LINTEEKKHIGSADLAHLAVGLATAREKELRMTQIELAHIKVIQKQSNAAK